MIAFEVYLFNFATRLSFLSRGILTMTNQDALSRAPGQCVTGGQNHAYMKQLCWE